MIAAQTIVGSFGARLGLDTSDYARGIINAEGFNRIFGASFATFVSSPLLGSIGILKDVGSAFIKTSSEVLGNAESLARLADQTGINIELLQALQGRLELAGFSADSAGTGMLRFSDTLGRARSQGGRALEVFEQLGVDIDRLDDTEAFVATIDQLSKMDDVATRNALTFELLGRRAGPDLVNAIGGGADAVRRLIQEQRALAGVVDGETVVALANLNTTVGTLDQLVNNLGPRLIGEFIAGIASESDTGQQAVEKLGQSLQDDLIPRFREAGEATGEWIGTVDELIAKIEQLLDLVDRAPDFLDALLLRQPRSFTNPGGSSDLEFQPVGLEGIEREIRQGPVGLIIGREP